MEGEAYPAQGVMVLGVGVEGSVRSTGASVVVGRRVVGVGVELGVMGVDS